MGKRMVVLVLAGILLLTAALAGCSIVDTDTPDSPWIDALPYSDPQQVWVSRPYEAGHQGIDISTDQVIDLISPGEGTFLKEMYYHAGVPRWQVNAEIRQGGYAIELLLEPGDRVSEAEAQSQYRQPHSRRDQGESRRPARAAHHRHRAALFHPAPGGAGELHRHVLLPAGVYGGRCRG